MYPTCCNSKKGIECIISNQNNMAYKVNKLVINKNRYKKIRFLLDWKMYQKFKICASKLSIRFWYCNLKLILYYTLAILTHFAKIIDQRYFFFVISSIIMKINYITALFSSRMVSITFKRIQKIQHHYIIVTMESEAIHNFPISWQSLIRFNLVIEKCLWSELWFLKWILL